MFSAVFLDLDGTLVDTRRDFLVAARQTLADFGVASSCVDERLVTNLIGKGTDHLLVRLFERVMGHCAEPEALAEQVQVAKPVFAEHYRRLNGRHALVFDGVAQGLAQLSRVGMPLACVTNKAGPLATQLLEQFGLLHHFSEVVGGDSVARRKPAPDLLHRAAARMGELDLSRCLMVGDSSNDAQAAMAAGCPCALVTYGYNHGRPVRAERALTHLDSLQGVDWAALAQRAQVWLLVAENMPGGGAL